MTSALRSVGHASTLQKQCIEVGVTKSSEIRFAGARAEELLHVIVADLAVESELPLGFVALGDLLGEVADDVLPQLSPPLAGALGAALLRTSPREGLDAYAVGRGLTEALHQLSLAGPLLLALDDLQWLDAPSARALAFAVRRLGKGTGIVATLRLDAGDPVELRLGLEGRLSEIEVKALPVGAVHDVLRQGGLTVSRRDSRQIHTASGGNPFYALELARSGAAPGRTSC